MPFLHIFGRVWEIHQLNGLNSKKTCQFTKTYLRSVKEPLASKSRGMLSERKPQASAAT